MNNPDIKLPEIPIILACNIDFNIPESEISWLLSLIRTEKRNRLIRFKYKEDILRGLLGELLVKYAFENLLNILYQDKDFYENEFGKPFLRNNNLFFNITHSGNWCAAAFHNSPIGIDIEEMLLPPYEIMQDNFSLSEIQYIENALPADKKQAFYSIWTLKESYIKMTGKGLSKNLKSFSFEITNGEIIPNLPGNTREKLTLHLSYPDNNHILAACFNGYTSDTGTKKLTSKELIANTLHK